MNVIHLGVFLAACIAIVVAKPPQRIIGGSVTSISQYPSAAAVLVTFDYVSFIQSCGSAILTSTALLSAAHCFDNRPAESWRVRVGSSFAHSGGTVHALRLVINHPNYHPATTDNDISVIRTQTTIVYIPNMVAQASIPGSAYNLADNQPVWAIGWGNIDPNGPASEELRHVQIWTVNQNVCATRYAEIGGTVTANMLCAGWLDVGGRDQCSRDSGGALYHNNVVVGVCSWGVTCGHPRYPGVNVRVSMFTSWIQEAVVCSTCDTHRRVGGSETTIHEYPYGVVVLVSFNQINFVQSCGGTIITSTSVLSAAHCFTRGSVDSWRVRVGSSFAHSGGTVHILRQIINHPNYNDWTFDNDISVLRTQIGITYIPNTVAPASIAGSAYNLADNQPVWAIGWGRIYQGGPASEQLRHVQIWSINQNICRSRYGQVGIDVTDNMLCSGWLDVGGRDQCQQDSGGPLIHNNVVVGVCSFGQGCALAQYPGINARVSRYTPWIQSVAA